MNENIVTVKLEIPGLVEIAAAMGKLAGTKLEPSAVLLPQATAPAQQSALPQQSRATVSQSMPSQPAPAPVQAAQPVYTPAATMVSVQQPVPQAAPVTTAPAALQTPVGVPTTAVPIMHTTDELAVAASQLVSMGIQQRLIEILNGFGVSTLMELPQEKYGAFAGCLKAEGAKF